MLSRKRSFAALTVLLLSGAAVYLHSQSSTQTTLRNPPPDADTALLVTLGRGDSEEIDWSGHIEVENGEVVELVGYEMRAGDLIHPPRRWEAKTRPAFAFARRPHDVGILEDLSPDAFLSPRFYVYLNANPATRVTLKTAQGDAEFRADEITVGSPGSFGGGRLTVERSAFPILVGRGGESPVSQPLTDNDSASVASTVDGDTWIAWTGFRNGADRVYAEKIRAGTRRGPDAIPHAVSPKDGDVFRTAIAEDAEGKVWVTWSERVDDNWDLFARGFDGQSWSRIERLTTGSQPDTQHKMAADSEGHLHLVWQGYRNNRAAIFYNSYNVNDGWSQPEQVSADAAPNCWEPSLTIDSNDNAYVGWDQYGPNGYDVHLRGRVNGEWRAAVAVAATARMEAYLTVAADAQDRIWLAWHESGVNWGKDWGYPFDITANATGLYNSRNVRVAVYENGRLRQPTQAFEAAMPGAGPGDNFYEYPQVAVDGQNRPWVFFRYRRPAQHNVYWRTPAHHALWEIQGSYYDGAKWSSPQLIPYSTGRNDMRFEVTRDAGGELVAAWPTDRRNFRDFVNMLPDVFAARLPSPEGLNPSPQLTELRLPPAEPARQPPNRPQREMAATEPVHPNEAQDVESIRDYVYEVNGKRYKIYRGDMHRHTEISWDGYNDGSTEDTYRYAIDAASLDFIAITEHNFGVMDEYDWWRSQKFVDIFRVGASFVPLFGYERSVPYPNGHRNVIFPYRGAPLLDVQHYEWNTGQDTFAYTRQGPERFFAYLRKYKAIAMPHTSGTNMGTDWADYDPEVEPVVEIYQSDRTSYECVDCWRAAPMDDRPKQFGGYRPDGFVSVAWEKGYRLGVQASSDHLGTHTAYSMLLAEENSRDSLVDAIRQRHTYGATDNIIVDFRLVANGREYMMGEEAEISAAPRFKIHVEGTDDLGEVEIVKNNQMVYAQTPGAKTADFEYRDNELPGEEASFYYLRVRQSDRDKQVAWSSPIWVTSR